MEGLVALMIVLGIPLMLAFKGMSKLTGFGEVKDHKDPGITAGKRIISTIVFIFASLLVISVWFEQPGSEQASRDYINSTWNHFVGGVVLPLFDKVVQVGGLVLIALAIYYVVRHLIRRGR